jgi:hypothetical protein
MRKSHKYLFFSIGLILLIMAVLTVFRLKSRIITVSLPPAVPYSAPENTELQVSEKQPEPEPEKKTAKTLPAEVNLKIPFTSQAPHQNWEMPYQHFCEEASVLMAVSYVKNQTIAGPDDADAKMRDIMEFEIKQFGYHEDTNITETATILRQHFNLSKVAVVDEPTVLQIKTALAEGKAVIVPAAGRQLGNPNFQSPGPLYHMLVIKGYRKNGDFITNDPGTRKGADYVYRADTLMNAIHDWNGGNVETGKKVMIVVG